MTRRLVIAVAFLLCAVFGTACASGWPAYHGNPARTGVDAVDRRMLPIKQAWRTRLDGKVYGQPLVWAGRVLAATENNTVYALDGHDGRVLWSRHLGAPVRNVAPSGAGGMAVRCGAKGRGTG